MNQRAPHDDWKKTITILYAVQPKSFKLRVYKYDWLPCGFTVEYSSSSFWGFIFLATVNITCNQSYLQNFNSDDLYCTDYNCLLWFLERQSRGSIIKIFYIILTLDSLASNLTISLALELANSDEALRSTAVLAIKFW